MEYLIPSSSHLRYFTGLDIEHIFMFQNTIYTYDLNMKLVKASYKGNVKHVQYLFEDLKNRDIKAPLKNLDARFYNKISKYVRSIQDCTDEFYLIRMNKEPYELNRIRRAAMNSLRIMYDLVDEIDPSMTEKEIEALLKIRTANHELSFRPIVASYSNAKYPHYYARDVKIGAGVMIDFGLEYKGYKADITDFVIFDSEYLQDKYSKLQKIFEYIVDRLSPGMLASKLHKIYIEAYKKYNLPLPPHAIGHGIGLDIHEYPIISESSDHVLMNTIITIEPGYYNDRYGMRYERDVIIYDDGIEVLDI
ncbi:MAG: M24 family metallopeptidase [Candidatus Anstonellales archaeon]